MPTSLTRSRRLVLEPYRVQTARWPARGRHILAQYDASSVVVYQAYAPEIGCFAAEHGFFGGAFSLSRMSWIKPNFLWMMHRSGWGTKARQEVVLAVWLRREGSTRSSARLCPHPSTRRCSPAARPGSER